MTLLGDAAAPLFNAIRAKSGDRRIRKLRARIARAIQLNCITPVAASKLQGVLGFYKSLFNRETRPRGDGTDNHPPIQIEINTTFNANEEERHLAVQCIRRPTAARNALLVNFPSRGAL